MENLQHLFKNNRNWTARIEEKNPGFFKNLAKEQHPEYLWIGCSDSRVPASEIAGLTAGDMFVHRNIANLVVHSDLNSQSVIQYAVEVLKIPHVIVCGHYGCGGVQAALESQSLGLIDSWLQHIKDVYARHRNELDKINDRQEKLNRFCELNVRAQVMNICHSPFVQQAWNKEQPLSVHGWIYNLADGRLKDLELSVHSAEQAATLLEGDK